MARRVRLAILRAEIRNRCGALSPMQVKNRSLLTIITHTLAQTGVDPRRVDFEITETALFDTTEDSLSVMHALRDLGASISLDDFGTGYSSLSYLRSFPFSKIKIDKSFVDKMETSEECAAIIQAVLGLARRLGMRFWRGSRTPSSTFCWWTPSLPIPCRHT